MMKKVIGALAASALVLGASGVSAVERAGAITVSPMLGYHHFDNPGMEASDTVLSLGIGYNPSKNWSVEALFSYAASNLNAAPKNDVDVQIGSISAMYNFDNGGNLVPYFGGGLGYRNFKVDGGVGDDDDAVVNFIGGLKYFITPQVALRLDARYLLDADGDAADYDDYQRQAGLQLLFGVPTAKPMAKPMVGDRDGDGVNDDADRCPNPPRGVKVDANGCPLDSDGDGVPDYLDKCPNTPAGTKVDANGCPLPMAPVRMELNVEFDFDKAEIRPGYHARLGDAAAFMKEHQNAVATIEGHTDSTGPDAYNQKLSERRAAAVRDYLIDKGKVEASRLKTVGYGETRPIADNATREGRQRNRRSIAVIIEVR